MKKTPQTRKKIQFLADTKSFAFEGFQSSMLGELFFNAAFGKTKQLEEEGSLADDH